MFLLMAILVYSWR